MNQAISVVIPNYNGQKLLSKYVPSILKSMRNGDELIIVDDASTDESVSWLTKEFHVKEETANHEYSLLEGKWEQARKKGNVKIVVQKLNQRYAAACNLGVQLANAPYIFLVNSDVKLFPETLSVLLPHFDNPQVFGVGCFENEPQADGSNIKGGKNALRFVRGRFIHSRANDFLTGETAWISGGSGMFDRSKWLELGGYDLVFKPAYWEDIDIAFRAKQRGWLVLFDQEAKVEHLHESTNSTALGKRKMEQISWQNGDSFLAKHANFSQYIQSLIWAPYWWVKASQFYLFHWGLFFITLVAAILRLNQLGDVPHGMTWDEAAIGYNGYAVLTTRRDEWLIKLPLSFRSFGDYKAPLAIYLNGPFTYFLGMKLWVVRLPFALAGIAAIWIMGMLVKTLLEWRDENTPFDHWPSAETGGIIAASILALSPWHLHFTRAGFESGMALTFLLLGCLLMLKALVDRKTEYWSIHFPFVQMIFAATSFAASIYTYHSAKIVTPLVVVFLSILLLQQNRWRKWKLVVFMLILLGSFCVPLGRDALWGNGGARFTQASVIGQSGITGAFPIIVNNFAQHLTPAFLLFGYTPTLRHGDGTWGVLFVTDFLVAIVGIFSLFSPIWKNTRNRNLGIFAVLWFVAGILPAAIGVDVPHPNRALLALPGVVLLSVLGMEWLWENLKNFMPAVKWLGSKKETNLLAKSVFGTFVLIHCLLFLTYQRHYYTAFAAESAPAFSDGYLEAFQIAANYEPHVDQIMVSNTYGQSYIYALFVRRTNPIWYQSGSLNKFLFVDSIHESDRERPNTLIIATPEQIRSREGDKIIYGSDGKARFIVVFPKRFP